MTWVYKAIDAMARKTKGIRNNGKHRDQSLPVAYRPGFMASMDGRLAITHALLGRFNEVAEDLGGVDNLSSIQRSLLERYIWLECMITRIEADMANAEDGASSAGLTSQWIQACNSLMGFSKTLGLNRVKKDVWSVVDAGVAR